MNYMNNILAKAPNPFKQGEQSKANQENSTQENNNDVNANSNPDAESNSNSGEFIEQSSKSIFSFIF